MQFLRAFCPRNAHDLALDTAYGTAADMTNTEADNLIATLPQPKGLRIVREGTSIVMSGGKSGAHSIAVGPSSAERVLVHWQGYVENNGKTLGYLPSKQAPKKRPPKKRRPPAPRYTWITHDRPPDAYIIRKPQSTGLATKKTFRSEGAARKEAAQLDTAAHQPRGSHEVIPVWKERRRS